MVKKPKTRTKVTINSSKQRNRLLLIPLIALVIKIGIIAQIQGFDWYAAGNGNLGSGLTALLDKLYQPPGAWYGADGENYLRALIGLANDGFFSTQGNLSYWPAGYPLLMWPFLVIFKSSFFGALAIAQSLLYAAGCALFVEEVRRTRLVRFTWPIALFLTFNPTLALNTITIGYELPTVALSLLAFGFMLRHFRLRKTSVVSKESILASISFALASFMQPRLIAFALAFFLIWALANFGRKSALIFLAISMSIVAIAPTLEILRNQEAMGFTAISTNLGTTMNIGAGPKSDGGYTNSATGVQCPEVQGNAAEQDSAKVRCVLRWYWENPSKTVKLILNKSVFFWSPWVGPAAMGTMARNPWGTNHPVIAKVRNESGIFLVWRSSGQPINWNLVKWSSWLWMIATLGFMLFGFTLLWKLGNVERLIGVNALALVIVNWLSTVATIGDHRFRIPSMGLSLTLQVIGFAALFMKGRMRFLGSSAPISWPSLRWNLGQSPDNLPS